MPPPPPPLGPIHTKPCMGVRRQQRFLSDSLCWHLDRVCSVCAHVHVSLFVCVCVDVCFTRDECGGGGTQGGQELWCRCPHSQQGLMNGICCDVTGKRVGVLAYAPWSSERLEFNQRDRLMYASWEQLIPLLVFPQSFYLSHSPFFFKLY